MAFLFTCSHPCPLRQRLTAMTERFPPLYLRNQRRVNLFQIQFMDAVNIKNKLTDFMHFYQIIDVLIIDDVQEFAGKPGTQNAYFNIFIKVFKCTKFR